MIKKIFLIALLLSPSILKAEVTAQQVNNALAKYCIPKQYDIAPDSEPTCNGVFEGVYKKGSDCYCYSAGDTPEFKHLIWDPVLRRCKPRCKIGYAIKNKTKQGKCLVGQRKLRISRN